MSPCTTLPLLLSLVFIIGCKDTSGEPNPAIENLYSDEAKNSMKELKNYMDNFYKEIDKFSDKLKENNNVNEAILNYIAISDYSKRTTCKHVEKEVRQTVNDEEQMKSFVDQCAGILRVDKLYFTVKIKTAEDKVKTIDATLKENAQNCKSSKNRCEEVKNKALEDLNNILSFDEKSDIQKGANRGLDHIKHNIMECFKDSSADLQQEIEESIKNITDCLDKLP